MSAGHQVQFGLQFLGQGRLDAVCGESQGVQLLTFQLPESLAELQSQTSTSSGKAVCKVPNAFPLTFTAYTNNMTVTMEELQTHSLCCKRSDLVAHYIL